MLQANSIPTINRLERGQEQIGKQPLKQRFIWAFLIYIVLGRSLAFLQVDSGNSVRSGEHTWTTWAIEHFSKLAAAPQVVLLGSSLMLTPINLADAQVLDRTLDGSQHHESAYFSKLMENLTGRHVQTFNFALPGEMPSDAFLITKLLLKGDKKPELIVYGVGPRDFMDNLLASPTSTDPYHYLAKLDDNALGETRVNGSWDERLDGFLGKINYPYGKREEITECVSLFLDKLTEGLLPESIRSRQITNQQLHTMLPLYHPMSIAVGECLFSPLTKQTSSVFKDNVDEYKRRYGTLKWQMFLSQLKYLADCLEIARKQGTDVVIVSMPITKVNRSLIPSLAWNAYKRSLRVVATSKGARFVDLDESKEFSDADFGDTVHLNTVGGIKLIQLIVADILQQNHLTMNGQALKQTSSRINAGVDL
ncbi:MAG: hypothetical protein C5B53_11460 [Candidatus Melainabacteria bacterium]|nr:MAG: hypothetical protein C5B53_11460 [Candidatus Melainabacteria bacterium]